MAADVLIINSSEDILEVLSSALADEGLTSDTAHVATLEEEPALIGELMRRAQPRCLVFDIAPLYDQSWRWFRERFCTDPTVAGVPIIVTTTNLEAVRSYGIDAPVLEIIGKPYDINRIVEAVETALGMRAGASPGGSPA